VSSNAFLLWEGERSRKRSVIGPMPGTVINCRQLSVPCASTSISSVDAIEV
jgi:hypothetical protein